jgi:tRNA-specific 2-thiouridylase
MSVGAQVRAHSEEIPATAWADGDKVEVRLERRIRGVAPGQSVVLYDGTRVVGSATIARATTVNATSSSASASGASASGASASRASANRLPQAG